MAEVKAEGVRDALNAITLNNNGTKVFLYERISRSIIQLDTIDGSRKVLKLDKDLQRQRWLCYCLFYSFSSNSSSDSVERLAILWYNLSKKKFCFTTHKLSSCGSLPLEGEKLYLNIEVTYDRLGYSAQRKDGRVEVIFYELKAPTKQKFWFFEYDVKNTKLTRNQNGVLPSASLWELPFLTEKGLHFVVVRKSQSLLATLKLGENHDWAVSDILADADSLVQFSRRALWCNCWSSTFAIFLVSRFKDGQTKADLWALDISMAAWKHIKTVIEFEGELNNFAIRLYDNNHLFIHFNSPQGSSFLGVENVISQVKNAFAKEESEEDVGIGLADVICPICLDGYDHPRTLNCGHSLCQNHLSDLSAKEANLNVIRCPLCRAPNYTKPPINYALKEAIEMLNKVRRSQTFDQRCATCKLASLDEELWHCMDCNDPTQSICANCILKHHSTHKLQSYHEYKEKSNEIEKIQRELETQAFALYEKFQEELAIKFQFSVYEKICKLHQSCLNTYVKLNGGRLKPLDVQKRKTLCLKHFSYVFEEILKSSEEFITSLEDSLFVENACSTLESLQKSTEI